MNADYVENIIRNIDEKSYTYKCILVDGTWGIGKSYMVRKALEDKKDKAFYVSLFGLESAQQIYHDILYQLLLHTENGGKLVEWCKDKKYKYYFGKSFFRTGFTENDNPKI